MAYTDPVDFVTSNPLTAAQLNLIQDNIRAIRINTAILADEKTTGTDGGGSSATTWNPRDMNIEYHDPDNIVTIASNKFIPTAGDFIINVHAICYKAGLNKLRLYNVTIAAVVKTGMSGFSGTSSGDADMQTLMWEFTANGTDEYRIDHYTINTKSSDGLGFATDDGSPEVYMLVFLTLLGG